MIGLLVRWRARRRNRLVSLWIERRLAAAGGNVGQAVTNTFERAGRPSREMVENWRGFLEALDAHDERREYRGDPRVWFMREVVTRMTDSEEATTT